MKKRILALTLALLTVITVLAGCSKANYSYESYESYIQLGKTDGIEINKSDINDGILLKWRGLFTVDDDELTETTYNKDTEGVDNIYIQVGDVANIDYVGKKDDNAFDGGTANGYDLTIGSNTFIDGFEDGLIGYKVGDKLSLNLTFPKNYSDTELAGADVVFDVSINSVKRTTGYPEYNDENVAKKTEYKTIAEFEEVVKKETVQNLLWQELYADSKIKSYPEKELKKYYNANIDNVMDYATMFGMTLESYVTTYQGYSDIRKFYGTMASYAQQQVKQELIVLRFIEVKPEFKMDEEKYNAEVEKLYNEYVAEQNFTGSLNKFKKQYDRRSLEITIYYDIVMDYLRERYVEKDDITKNGFVTERDGIRYYVNNEYLKGWQELDPDGDGNSSCYYFDANGYAPNNTTLVVKGLVADDSEAERCARFGENGLYVGVYTGPVDDKTGTRYYKDGIMQTGWQELDLDGKNGNETYFFDTETGYMVKNDIADVNGSYYKFDKDGKKEGDAIQSGLVTQNKTMFFKDGTPLTGWIKYYTATNTAENTTLDGINTSEEGVAYYWCDEKGVAVKAPTKIDGIYYDFEEDGHYKGKFTGELDGKNYVDGAEQSAESDG